MLCLTRKKDESIAIDGGRIIVTVLQADRGKIRLGIEAPPEVVIDRWEIHERKEAERLAPLAVA